MGRVMWCSQRAALRTRPQWERKKKKNSRSFGERGKRQPNNKQHMLRCSENCRNVAHNGAKSCRVRSWGKPNMLGSAVCVCAQLYQDKQNNVNKNGANSGGPVCISLAVVDQGTQRGEEEKKKDEKLIRSVVNVTLSGAVAICFCWVCHYYTTTVLTQCASALSASACFVAKSACHYELCCGIVARSLESNSLRHVEIAETCPSGRLLSETAQTRFSSNFQPIRYSRRHSHLLLIEI